MPTRNRTAGQCIFCAFKSQTPWSLRCSGNGASHQVRLRSELIPRPNEDGLATYRPSFLPPPNGEVAQTYRPSFLSALSENESSAKGKKPNLRVAKRRVDLFESIKAVDRNHAVARGHVSLKELKRLSNRTSSSGELREKTRLGDLKKIIREQLPKTEKALAQSLLVKSLELDEDSLAKQFSSFRHKVEASFSVDVDGRVANSENLYATLRQVYIERGEEGLDAQLKYAFYGHVAGSRFTKSDIQNQKEMADLRYPAEWFPATRRMHRTIHLHVGPTNSGKTYHALKRLEEADSGVYAGPLRLLAHEVYTRMNAKGKRCTLVTGEERRIPDENADFTTGLSSCTVEMVPLNRIVDVAVIDEIQMINNPERGWAWTQALLGVRATELHLCGEDRTVPLIRELAAAVGDKLEIHRYERLSPLKMMRESLDGDLKKLRKGDCVVSFSVMGIHALRKEIERTTGRKVAIVYGSLPPETRAQQARLFNDPDNEYDYLVASDAIGMGLNLSIKRIIFETSQRFNGYERQTLKVADIKQIAGRAGRYRTAAQATQDTASEAAQDLATEDLGTVRLPRPPRSQNVGYVTTLEKFDFPIVDTAMKSEPEPIMTAGLFPPAAIIERFASYFPPETPFGYILLRLHEISLVHPRFYLCGLKDQLSIADVIQPVKNLTTNDRIIFCAAPAAIRDENGKTLLKALAHCVAEQKGGVLLDIPEFKLDVLDREPSRSREYLGALESLHKGLVLYLWLSYRFAGVFNTRPLAFHVKGLVEDAIENALSKFSYNEMTRQRLRVAREKNVLKNLK
ncbi:ATP-dependent RNA helicase SUV3 mitochondrial precursor, partial [Cryomyces antarcticus]